MRKGFTLIELLAVIVILAIIAAIATPIVLSIIEDTKESATLRSAEYYLDAVETSIATSILKNTNINDGTYKLKGGDICLDSGCVQKLKVEIKGETPESGTINIQEGQINGVTLFLDNKVIANSKDNGLSYIELEYEIGEEVIFNPGDEDRTWNVIDEDANTVTLMLSENLGEVVAWYANSNDNSYGPKTALEYLNSLTGEWDNVDSIKKYTYINNLNGTTVPNGYQKIEIQNGVTKLTHKDGETITEVTGESKTRLLTLEEVFEIAQKTNTNLKEENLRAFIERNLSEISEVLEIKLTTVKEVIAYVVQTAGMWHQYEREYYQTYYTVWKLINNYSIETTYDVQLPEYLYKNLYSGDSHLHWFLSSYVGHSFFAWGINRNGHIAYDYVVSACGVRPVITIPKSKL